MAETPEELAARHKKELKALEGERRAAIKNAKSRGKKAKAAVKDAEFKYDGLAWDLKERHRAELAELSGGSGDDAVVAGEDERGSGEEVEGARSEISPAQAASVEERTTPTPEEAEEERRQKALQKKLKKKNAQRQKELDREKRIQEENAAAGPSRREMEMDALRALHLSPRGLEVEEVAADGNCLYRAVGAQCRRLGLDAVDVKSEDCYGKVRELCAEVLMGPSRAEYEPFAECGEGHVSDGDVGNHPATYAEYVKNVRSTSVWGGQLELRALSEGLKCPIVVFSAEAPPLTMGAEHAPAGEGGDDEHRGTRKALLLSFHRHYYALGEHYNSVVPK
ncbi:hypothetical protein ACHAWF_013949 [Thalassiosira exigua]